MQQIQHATYQNWQMPLPPPDSQYGYFGPCCGPPFPHSPAKNHVMYHTGQHTASNMGPCQYPNWYSGLSSAGSSGSLGSLGRVGARNKSSSGRKSRRGKEKAQSASSQEFKYDARMTLHQIKGKFSHTLLAFVCQKAVFSNYWTCVNRTISSSWYLHFHSQDASSKSPRTRIDLGSFSSASHLSITLKYNWYMMKPCLQSKVTSST